jgi:methylmalonyl-CoA mutase C-terminal domain/subunit
MEGRVEHRKKILVAKVGLDGHDLGAKVICQAFRNAGMEVIYTGLRQTPEKIVAAAMDEDVDVIGISTLSGAHMHHIPRIMELLKENKAEGVVVIAGGTIPIAEVPELERMGVARVYPTDSDTSKAVEFVKGLAARRA